MKKKKVNKQLLIALLSSIAVLCITAIVVLTLEAAIKQNKAGDLSDSVQSTSTKNDDTAGIDIFDGDDTALSSDPDDNQKSEEADIIVEENAPETFAQEELPEDNSNMPAISQGEQPAAEVPSIDDGSAPVMTDTPLGEDELPDIE